MLSRIENLFRDPALLYQGLVKLEHAIQNNSHNDRSPRSNVKQFFNRYFTTLPQKIEDLLDKEGFLKHILTNNGHIFDHGVSCFHGENAHSIQLFLAREFAGVDLHDLLKNLVVIKRKQGVYLWEDLFDAEPLYSYDTLVDVPVKDITHFTRQIKEHGSGIRVANHASSPEWLTYVISTFQGILGSSMRQEYEGSLCRSA